VRVVKGVEAPKPPIMGKQIRMGEGSRRGDGSRRGEEARPVL